MIIGAHASVCTCLHAAALASKAGVVIPVWIDCFLFVWVPQVELRVTVASGTRGREPFPLRLSRLSPLSRLSSSRVSQVSSSRIRICS